MTKILFDFNGTLFFDSRFHLEAWAKIYRELDKDPAAMPDRRFFLGARNDDIIRSIVPKVTPEECARLSGHKEALYRETCREHPDELHLASGAEALLQRLKTDGVPFTLASASIKANVDFYFETFRLDRWFDREICVYDDGTYADKGEMHVEAARRLGAELSECVVVEDSISAILHAKENGAGRIVAIGEENRHSELIRAGADHCIRDFTEFCCEWLTN